jgi:class 3 adenylate cyclase
MPQVVWMEYYGALTVIICFAIINSILPFLLKSGWKLSMLVNIYITTMALAETRIMYVSGGVYHTATDPQILAVLCLMALFFLGRKMAFFWFFVGVSIIITYGVLQSLGVEFIPQFNPKYILFQTVAATAGHLLIVFMVVNMYDSEKNKALKMLQHKNKIIADEKQRCDDLLLNILPAEVMEELKETGKTTAKNYDLVTVLFADIKDFTSIVENLSPEELVSGIDEYFEMFDRIVEKYGVEKIKTVGDAYICVSGLPVANSSNPVTIVNVGLEMIEAVKELSEKRKNLGQVAFELRIGIHSGPVVAGVVGVKKFAYDIWGDTVNMAARMQQHGEPGCVNISNTTHDLVKHRFNCTSRGLMEAKHKGMVDMYFVSGKKEPVQMA